MKQLIRIAAVVVAYLCVTAAAMAQNSGTATNHAFLLGKGAGQQGHTSLLCTSAQLAVGQSAADPICQTITGDVTISAGGVTAIGAGVVHSTMLNADVFSTAHSWSAIQSFSTLVDLLTNAAPSTPASGHGSAWYDATDLRFHDKNASGAIGTTVVASTCSAHQWFVSISTAGAANCTQPAFSDISGAATPSQLTGFTASAIYKGAGASAPVASALTDDGTKVSTAEDIDLTSKAIEVEVANAGTTGTTVNMLAKLTGAPATAVITATTDTGGAIGIVVGGAGTTSNARVAVGGQASCVFDGATVAGDYVQISGTVAGNCHDAGSTYPSANQVIGRVMTTNAAGGTFAVLLNDEIKAAAGGGGGGVSSVTPGSGLVSAVTVACSQTAITSTGTLSNAECVNAQSGTTYTFVDGDRAKLVTASNAAAQAYTLPQAGAASAFASGWFTTVVTNGAGVVTITPTTSTIGGNSTLRLPSGYSARITSDGTNYQVSETAVNSLCGSRVFVKFTGSGTNGAQTINKACNVSGVSRTGTGLYTVTIGPIPYSSADFACNVTSASSLTNGWGEIQTSPAQSATSISVAFITAPIAAFDPSTGFIICEGLF